MPDYLQKDRPLKITTPLGPDVLLLTGLRGQEQISHLFDFQVDLLANLTEDVQFDKIIGQSVTVEMRMLDGNPRYFNGIVKRFSQGRRDENFAHFQAEIVPRIWLLTKKIRSRIFQHITVPDILRRALTGLDVNYDLTGTYHPRDYCVQYGESDFAFVSRLMEEEGIYYFFAHSDGNHQMMISDSTGKHPTVPGQSSAIYDEVIGEDRTDMRVLAWEKVQELRSGECTLWDYCFELPGNHLEAQEKTIGSVAVGKVVHKLNVANDRLEIYDYPGRFAQRCDGINPSGGERPTDIAYIFTDRVRTVRLRMEQEEVRGIRIKGKSDCGQFVPGHKFTLERHFDADASYLLMSVKHNARDESYRSDTTDASNYSYNNRFTCIPETLRYRPQCITKRPKISGMQTATVVGPPGEEIFVDKYGRVKVQFHWDREGKMNADSSCWLRVAQVWAGKGWGAFFWPRIGHEVVVIFEEGDPDQPLVIGSVYNADNMPWYRLPMNKLLSGFKSASEGGTAKENYNGIVMNDEAGKEHLAIHSEHNLSLNSEDDKMIHSGRHKGERVAIANTFTVGKLLPVGGGSGGGYEEGSPMPDPPPTGVWGLNSAITYGTNFQGACPMNHQLAIGNNLQMCINPIGLASGAPGAAQAPLAMQALLGGGIGGNMQFTLGTNAQFTLGQTFEISIGPPKIEIHAQYTAHPAVIALSSIIGGLAILFAIGYDLRRGKNGVDHYNYIHAPDGPAGDDARASAKQDEQSGDKERVDLVLAYQIVIDLMLVALMLAEALEDKMDWTADDVMKGLYTTDINCLKVWSSNNAATDPEDGDWPDIGTMVVGAVAAAAIVVAEIKLAADERDSATSSDD